MAYSEITNAEIDTDSPLTQTLMTKMRDNPLELLSGATGYMNAGNWVPVDWTFGDQSGDGTIYNRSVDGAATEVDYTLSDGWEYMFIVRIQHSSGASEPLRVEISQDAGSSFIGLVSSGSYASGENTNSVVFFNLPRVDGVGKRCTVWRDGGGISESGTGGGAFDVVKIRFSNSLTITSGTIRAFRRREYITAS